MEAAAKLAEQGIEAEVLELRVVGLRGWLAGELSAQIGEEVFDVLDAPVERVCGLNICSPFSPVLEDKNFPHPEDIVAAVKRVLNK